MTREQGQKSFRVQQRNLQESLYEKQFLKHMRGSPMDKRTKVRWEKACGRSPAGSAEAAAAPQPECQTEQGCKQQ